MRLSAVLFDLDGTLADTLDDIGDAMNHALAALGLPGHDRETYRGFVGDGAAKLVERALGPAGQRHHPAALAGFRARYREHQLDRTRPYPGVARLLAELGRRGIPMGVLSNKPDVPTRELVGALFADVPFGFVAGECPGVPLKPDPAGALRAAAHLGVAPGRTLFVGDSPVDMLTARAAGMVGAGVTWGFRTRAQLLEAGAQAIVDRAEDVLPLLA